MTDIISTVEPDGDRRRTSTIRSVAGLIAAPPIIAVGLVLMLADRMRGRNDSTKRGGLAATFKTREDADLAIEHLVQQHHIDRAAIYAGPAADENSSGSAVSGGDAPSRAGKVRNDAPLRGNIRVTVATGHRGQATLRQAMADAGAIEVRAI